MVNPLSLLESMKASFSKFIVFSILTLTYSSRVDSLEILVPSGTYNGDLDKQFPYTITANPEGTTAILTGNLYILNIDNCQAATPLSCFLNSSGPITIIGRRNSISFMNLCTTTNGAALNSTPATSATTTNAAPYTISGLSSCVFTNCRVLANSSTPTDSIPAPKGGAIYVSGSLFLQNTQNVLFQNNYAASNGGGIWVKNGSINKVHQAAFSSNVANNGGAIGSSESFSITQCPSVIFATNSANLYGGAIHAVDPTTTTPPQTTTQKNTTINISGNGIVKFEANNAKSGGAIYGEGNVTFSNNGVLILQNNSAFPEASPTDGITVGLGGALFAKQAGTTPSATPSDYTGITISNQQTIFVANNFASTSGGAIHTDKLSISSSGSTMFRDNVSKDGGAIYIADNGTLSLSADYGPMVFYHNLKKTNQTNTTIQRNAISLGKGATISSLSASENYSLIFYDPITGALPDTANNQELTINPNSSSKYTGSVIFSGLDTDNTNDATSTIYQKVKLSNGKLILANKATLAVLSFTQEEDSILLMDGGTTLQITEHSTNNGTAQNNTDGQVTITDLHLNLDSLNASSQAKIETKNSSGSIILNGSVSIDDVSGHAYENHSLFNQDSVTLNPLVLTTQNDNQITTNVEFPEAQYGYLGSWTFSWENGENNTKTLKATWTRTGFLPSPERQSTLVPNSLWGALIDLRSLNDAATSSCDGFNYGRGLYFAGISNIFHRERDENSHGFRRISGGYIVGANSQTIAGSVFGVAFAQMFGRSKDYVVSTSKSQSLMGTAYLSIKHPINNIIFTGFSARACYSRTTEEMTTQYTFAPKKEISWDNNCWLGEIGGNLPIILRIKNLPFNQFVPFVHAQIGYAEHESFKEKQEEARSFDSSYLINVSIPAGFKIDRRSHKHPDFYSLSVAYVPDVYRKDPKCTTLLLANNISWITSATNLDRYAIFFQGSTHTSINNNIEIFTHGNYELRKSSRNYSIDIGSKFRF
ncbi:putative outer membrane protein pmp13 [Chlamydia avium]|nr:putative outer membrane protein pmp13 [Chlamydia avium]